MTAKTLSIELLALISEAADKADLDINTADILADHHRAAWYTWLAEQAYDLGRAAEAKRLIGIADDDFEDGKPDQYGLLDRITVGITRPNDAGNRMVYTRCNGGCGDKAGGTMMLIARDFEGGQDGLTLAELAHGALRHIGEEHDGEADWPVPAAAEMLPPLNHRETACICTVDHYDAAPGHPHLNADADCPQHGEPMPPADPTPAPTA